MWIYITINMTDYKNLKKLFNDHKCVLLSDDKSLDLSKLTFICSCDRKESISINDFKEKGHCSLCDGKTLKLTYSYVKQQYENAGCRLLTTKYNKGSDMSEFVCACGISVKVPYKQFIRSKYKKCKKCTTKILSDMKRYDYETIRKEFENAGCKLLTETYTKDCEKLDFVCKCGRVGRKTYQAFRKFPWCKLCGYEIILNSIKYSYEEVYNFFKLNGCKLLSDTYIDCETKLHYRCICGNNSYISLSNFKCGKRCGCIKSKGESFIIKVLSNLEIQYEYQKTYDDCINIKCLPFDFYVKKRFIIEFDGGQHFYSIKLFGGDEDFAKRVKNDDIKNKYCIKNKIPILRISYKELQYIDMIISLYVSLLENDLVPPIMFTNKKLYKRMYDEIKGFLIVDMASHFMHTNNGITNEINEYTYNNIFLTI